MKDDVLSQLEAALEQRKLAEANSSYVASLYAKGLNKILEKVGEESTEAIIAAKDFESSPEDAQLKQELIGEVADLWFHSMVALTYLGLSHKEVLATLQERFGLSGLEEKASRKS